MVHDPGQIGVGKRDAAKRRIPQDFTRRGICVRAEEEARLGAQVGVPPAVQNDAGDIPLAVDSAPANIDENCSRMRLSYSRKEVDSNSARPRVTCSPIGKPGDEKRILSVSTTGESGDTDDSTGQKWPSYAAQNNSRYLRTTGTR